MKQLSRFSGQAMPIDALLIGDFSPTSGPAAGDMPDELDLGYSPAFLAATDFIKD